MQGIHFISGLIFFIVGCFGQGNTLRPSFPDVFQTEIEGTFVQENAVVEIDVSMFYDRTNNRAALSVTKEAEVKNLIYNFDSDEMLSIERNDCDVQEIGDKGFFPFNEVGGKKKMQGADEVFYFSKSKLDKAIFPDQSIPTLVYKANLDIPRFGNINCDITHIFSNPDLELPTCHEGLYCNSTLMSISVSCKNKDGAIIVDHVYRFSRFMSKIDDESVFLPPAGVYCAMKNRKAFPSFPSYFSFTFDIIERPNDKAVFDTHKQVWYDAEYKILRIDEFEYNGLQDSSRIFDLKAEAAFTIIARLPSCEISPVPKDIKLYDVTQLPRAFFSENDSKDAVYVGKRNVNGLDYEVWSLSWVDKISEARIVEDIYFLQIAETKDLLSDKERNLQISHVNMYIYESSGGYSEYELSLLKYFSINNFRSSPKEWVAFDVATCFRDQQKIDFILKLAGPKLVKESQDYRELLQQFYDKIIATTGVSIVRISELMGIFDGTQIVGLRGSILDNDESSGWPKNSSEPRMDKTFNLIEKAASEKKLTIRFKGEKNIETTFTVTSVKAVKVTTDDFPKPSFPDVFQTEIEGTFIQDNAAVSMQASMFYDRTNNRAALYVAKEGEVRKSIYNFDTDESISINGNECDVQKIPEEQLFFKFSTVNGEKKLAGGDEVFSFTKSELDKQIFPDDTIPKLVYTSSIELPEYGNMKCDVSHIFSKPNLELQTCSDGLYCSPTLMSMTVKCKDDEGQTVVDNSYRFSRFKRQIEDESVFSVPAGVFCYMKSSKAFPDFPTYFSFSFDLTEKPYESGNSTEIFTTHKEVWCDTEFKIIRIDEMDGLKFSSRIFDLKAQAAFTIVSSVPTCDIGPIPSNTQMDKVTLLPKAFFYRSSPSSNKTVYAGKRNVRGLDYQVWSLLSSVEESEAKVVEEIFFLEITSNEGLSPVNSERETHLQISHVDTYTYQENEETNVYELTLLKSFFLTNYRSKPKEWAAFDVDVCFKNKQKMEFTLKVEGPDLVKGSQSYREILEALYNKIIAATGVSIVRISELTGVFDGVKLLEIRGTILDNSESSGWPENSKEPGMEETFRLIKKAASENKLSITFTGENNIESKVDVTSVEAIQVPSQPKKDCFSGASLAAASLVLLLMGVCFGVAAYYVFLKKRKRSDLLIRMSDIENDTISHDGSENPGHCTTP